ncbi:coiled-coil domain-containing protein 102A [Drosophila santomea]|uniref:coiled-coil domain-containing protein 102A n=1 Tax=Drosophila santomea TaxID=129105 RepID=UPI001CCB6FE0|nr:coiled-coil domain-containing protein 102A [Drosophila santomea]
MLYCQAMCLILLNIACVSRSHIIMIGDTGPDLAPLYEPASEKREIVTGDSSEGSPCDAVSAAQKSCGLNQKNAKTKASSIAIKAAQDAKAANDAQVAAGEAASLKVKLELAEKAVQAARAAEAALAGKQQIMEQLELEQKEAEAVLGEVRNSIQSTQANSEAAMMSLSEAKIQLDQLKLLVTEATAQMGNIEIFANGAQMELDEKGHLLEAANRRLESIYRQVIAARQDYDKTKKAAYKAACAAVEAKQKAQRMQREISEAELQAKSDLY